MIEKARIPEYIRVSSGSATVLGLLSARLDAPPTTVYLLTYRRGKCSANCAFCPQARQSGSKVSMLSRVSWPVYSTQLVINRIGRASNEEKTKRICIQSLNYPEVFAHLLALVEAIHEQTRTPISVSCQPLERENIVQLAQAGTDRIGIPLDAATEQIFSRTKGSSVGGPYRWEKQFELLREAVDIFGKEKVTTHLIVGLGETEKQMIKIIQICSDIGVVPGLFAFTPIPGTFLANEPPPTLERYRRIQLARYMILHGITRYEDMRFDVREKVFDFGVDDRTLRQAVEEGEPFRTSGCPDCNRPYYNEKPSGPAYNYPRKLTRDEALYIKQHLGLQ